MLLTFKIKHERDFSHELSVAKSVAEYAIKNRDKLSTACVKHFGLKSAISNQILRKYGNDKKCKRVSRVNLIAPGCSCRLDKESKTITIIPLKLKLDAWFDTDIVLSIRQAEIGPKYACITCEIAEQEQHMSKQTIGVDLNATGHCIVIANASTGKVKKLAKSIKHIKKTYRSLRAKAQSKKDLKLVRKLGKREANKTRDVLHKASKFVVEEAKRAQAKIALEDIKNIRKTKKTRSKELNFTLNSWPFAMFQAFVVYKAKLQGVQVEFVNPAYTSQRCSRCGHIDEENRKAKQFVCISCAHIEHADANAAFNIAAVSMGVFNHGGQRAHHEGPSEVP
jgi:putative transposase